MNCIDIEQRIVDYIDGKLNADEAKQVQEHINSCDDCKLLYDETVSLFAAFNKVEEQIPNESLREGFYKLLEEEKQILDTKVVELPKQENEFHWKRAFQVAASLVLMFSGYLFGSLKVKQDTNEQIIALQKETYSLKEGMVLAMIENQSVSKRIQAVNYTEGFEKPDTKILEALIERMQYDGNINVRLAAAEALSEFPESIIVKDAFIEALTIQKDPGLQIAIIQFLVKIQEKRAIAPLQKLLEHSDTPDFVKDQVSSGLSEII
ncbi:HEAT repeat domain-containing protein [Seonamhaeicola marinus]|uniref:Putative zinc-finger domain-containing protein n=1 Tax=Seonamhaeicola marinus TaxID=1912246 RepID=A0A5D0HW57_9FLAO|nr:HEAT repeat domain-containing protein [Seonamhaeicola marinus]TYA75060.1 hypothetical protein FUA24_16075 [Seonamhaeicola marinus]